MTEETENLVLEHLRRMRTSLDRIELDIGDLKLRMSACETSLANVQVQLAGLNVRLDRCEDRLGRIERRLDLADA